MSSEQPGTYGDDSGLIKPIKPKSTVWDEKGVSQLAVVQVSLRGATSREEQSCTIVTNCHSGREYASSLFQHVRTPHCMERLYNFNGKTTRDGCPDRHRHVVSSLVQPAPDSPAGPMARARVWGKPRPGPRALRRLCWKLVPCFSEYFRLLLLTLVLVL